MKNISGRNTANMIYPRSIFDVAIEYHRGRGEWQRYRSALVRRCHLRACRMYGYDSVVALRYRELMIRRRLHLLNLSD